MTTPDEGAGAWRAAVRAAVEKQNPLAGVRAALDGPSPDRRRLRSFEDELGLTGLQLPEAWGGSGGSHCELAGAFEELGRVLYPGPALETAVALDLLTVLEAHPLVERILRGSRVAIAIESPAPPVAKRGGDTSWTFDRAPRCLGDPDADIVLVHAIVDGEDALLATGLGQAADAIVDHATMEPSRRFWSTKLGQADVAIVGTGASTTSALGQARRLAAFLLASESAGGADACLRRAVDYANERVQFGRPIGQNQAIKHQCAHMLVLSESARLAVEAAATELDNGRNSTESSVAVHLAKACAADAFYRCATMSLHIFGGRGYLWEDDAHLFLRRAIDNSVIFGDTAAHRAAIADHLRWASRTTMEPAR